MHHLNAAALTSLVILLPASRADSRIWSVYSNQPGDAPTIQAGIDSSATGDSVLVHAGTYPEHIDFKGKLIAVVAASGPGNTILDGSIPAITGDVVTFQSGEGQASRLEGFTIQGGSRGVWIHAAEPTVIGNIIRGNTGSSGGAGILCDGTSDRLWAPIIVQNDIRQNVASGHGGGIAIREAMKPEVSNNIISENESHLSGGGIYVLSQYVGTVLQYNIIDSNVAANQGGGIYVQGTSGIQPLPIDIAYCVLIKNSAEGGGMGTAAGGGAWLSNAQATMHNLTVVKNSVPAGKIGGGIVLDGGPYTVASVQRSIIAFNTSGSGIACTGAVITSIRNNIGWSNAGGNGTGTCISWDQTNGNVIADPLFCNIDAGEVTVSSNSPALLSPGGPMGAYTTPGCSGTPALPTTWGSLKTRFH